MQSYLPLSVVGMVALAFWACESTTHEAPSLPGEGEICFTPEARGVTTTSNIREFKMSAFARIKAEWYEYDEMIMDNVLVTRRDTLSNRWEYSPAVKWPDHPVSFYAVSPASIDVNFNPYWEHTIKYQWTPEKSSVDMLIGSKQNVLQSQGAVSFNFRHALAKVSLKLYSSLQDDIHVHVAQASIYCVGNNGDFMFPRYDTPQDLNVGDIYDRWTVWDSNAAGFDFFTAESEDDYLYLTETPTLVGAADNFFLPIELVKYTGSGGWVSGTRIQLVCKFVKYNADGSQTVLWPNAETDRTLLAPNSDYGFVRTALRDITPDNRWLPGYSYNYSVDVKNFGKNPDDMPSRGPADLEVSCEMLNFGP